MSDWIDVYDRKPERRGDVLVYGRRGARWEVSIAYYDPAPSETWIPLDDREPFTRVTHWMPLPDPPE